MALAVIALGAAVATRAFLPLDNNDIWIHLTTGRLILQEHRVPLVDRYTFPTEGTRYVAHEWLPATFYAAAERLGGAEAVVVAGKALPALAAVALLLAALRAARLSWGLGLPVAALSGIVLRRRILARPELLAISLVLGFLALLWRDRSAAREGHRTRALWLLVPLEALWVNVHGSFPLGIVLVVAFALAELAERLLLPRDARARWVHWAGGAAGAAAAVALASADPRAFGIPAAAVVACVSGMFVLDGHVPLFAAAPAPGRGQGVLRLLALAAAMTAAILLNPRGAEMYLFPFEFTASANTITGVVNEWKPLLVADHIDQSLFLSSFGVLFATFVAGLGLAVRRRALGMLEVALFLVLSVLVLRHVRWAALSALALTPVLASLLGAVRGAAPLPGRARRLAALGLGVVAAGLGVAAVVSLAGPPTDRALEAALAVAIGCAAVALTVAARPAIPLTRGADGAIAASLAILLLALVVGIPDIEGTRRRTWLGSARDRHFAVSLAHAPAIDLLRERRVKGRLFTEYHWAAYAIHELWPDVKVFLDSRSEVHGPELLQEYLDAKVDRKAARRMLDTYQPDLVLVRHFPLPEPAINVPLVETLAADPAWGLVLVDDESILYARGEALAALPPPLRVFQPIGFAPSGPVLDKPGLEEDLRAALQRSPDSAFLRTALAAVLQRRGRTEEALAELDAGWTSNPHYAGLPFLAGEIEAQRGDTRAAARWLRRAIDDAPGWQAPRRALAALPGEEAP